MSNPNNLTFHVGAVTRDVREKAFEQRGLTIWLTGLSASGKSTIAAELERQLIEKSFICYRLDGDNVRLGLNKNLGFSPEDRSENIRRIAEVAKLFADASAIAITSFISPYTADRVLARETHQEAGIPFIEVFIDVPLSVAEDRDPKGLYKKARSGAIKGFTGISAPYEKPTNPEIHIKTNEKSIEDAVIMILEYLQQEKLLK